MRQTSAESREIDLMMRQWKPAKQMLALASAAPRTPLIVLLALAAGLAASPAQAQESAPAPAPVRTRTALSVATRQVSRQAGPQTETVFSAHVTDALGDGLSRSGTVSFDLETASLGSAIVDEHGDATLAVTSLPVDDNGSALPIHATYHPALADKGATVAGSVSAPSMLQADATGIADFVISANPTTLTVTRGQAGTTTLTVTPLNGFNEQVTLSCSNPPAQTTCTFSPVIESTAKGAFTSTLQIQTEASSGAKNAAPAFGSGSGSHVAFAWLLPGLLALAGFAGSRKRVLGAQRNRLVLLLVTGSMLAVTVGLVGCSSRYGYIHHPPLGNGGTATGTYTLVIDASGNDGSAVTSHSINVVLQVQ